MTSSSDQQAEPPLKEIGKFWGAIRSWGPLVISCIVAVVPILHAAWIADANPAAYAPAAGVFILSATSILLQIKKPSYQHLSREAVKSAKRGQAVELAIAKIVRKISQQHDVHGPQFRASVYYLSGDEFVMIVRNSADSNLEKPGRRRYPIRQGVIGRGWKHKNGVVAVRDLSEDKTEWLSEMANDHGLSRDEAAALTMHSCSIGAIRLDTSRNGAVGMVVFESLKRRGIDTPTLTSIKEAEYFDLLTEFVEAFAPETPRGEPQPRGGQKEIPDAYSWEQL